MSEITIVNGQINTNTSALATARAALFDGLAKTGEVLSRYASEMNAAFGAEWWNAKGEIKKMVKAEHAQFIEMGETKLKWSRSQIDTYWSRVKDAAGRTKSGNKVSGGQSVDDMNIRDLKTILNRIENTAVLDAELSHKVKGLLIQAADQMGIDTSKLAIAE